MLKKRLMKKTEGSWTWLTECGVHGFAVFFFHCASSIVACMFQPQEKTTTKVEKGNTLPVAFIRQSYTDSAITIYMRMHRIILTFPLDSESCHTDCALQHDAMVYDRMNP